MSKSKSKYIVTWTVYENNGGMLTLVIERGGAVEYMHMGYEYGNQQHPPQLAHDLTLLLDDPSCYCDWDGNDLDGTADHANGDLGEVVADAEGVYPGRMGGAAYEALMLPDRERSCGSYWPREKRIAWDVWTLANEAYPHWITPEDGPPYFAMCDPITGHWWACGNCEPCEKRESHWHIVESETQYEALEKALQYLRATEADNA